MDEEEGERKREGEGIARGAKAEGADRSRGAGWMRRIGRAASIVKSPIANSSNPISKPSSNPSSKPPVYCISNITPEPK